MTNFHAVLLDECGDEFGVSVEAANREEACDKLRENYPECRGIVQCESPSDTRERERRIYARAQRQDYDYEG